MAVAENPSDRYAEFQTRIDAARKRLADDQKMEWAEVGSILEGISEEISEAESHPEEKRDEIYDRARARLDEIDAKLGV